MNRLFKDDNLRRLIVNRIYKRIFILRYDFLHFIANILTIEKQNRLYKKACFKVNEIKASVSNLMPKTSDALEYINDVSNSISYLAYNFDCFVKKFKLNRVALNSIDKKVYAKCEDVNTSISSLITTPEDYLEEINSYRYSYEYHKYITRKSISSLVPNRSDLNEIDKKVYVLKSSLNSSLDSLRLSEEDIAELLNSYIYGYSYHLYKAKKYINGMLPTRVDINRVDKALLIKCDSVLGELKNLLPTRDDVIHSVENIRYDVVYTKYLVNKYIDSIYISRADLNRIDKLIYGFKDNIIASLDRFISPIEKSHNLKLYLNSLTYKGSRWLKAHVIKRPDINRVYKYIYLLRYDFGVFLKSIIPTRYDFNRFSKNLLALGYEINCVFKGIVSKDRINAIKKNILVSVYSSRQSLRYISSISYRNSKLKDRLIRRYNINTYFAVRLSMISLSCRNILLLRYDIALVLSPLALKIREFILGIKLWFSNEIIKLRSIKHVYYSRDTLIKRFGKPYELICNLYDSSVGLFHKDRAVSGFDFKDKVSSALSNVSIPRTRFIRRLTANTVVVVSMCIILVSEVVTFAWLSTAWSAGEFTLTAAYANTPLFELWTDHKIGATDNGWYMEYADDSTLAGSDIPKNKEIDNIRTETTGNVTFTKADTYSLYFGTINNLADEQDNLPVYMKFTLKLPALSSNEVTLGYSLPTSYLKLYRVSNDKGTLITDSTSNSNLVSTLNNKSKYAFIKLMYYTSETDNYSITDGGSLPENFDSGFTNEFEEGTMTLSLDNTSTSEKTVYVYYKFYVSTDALKDALMKTELKSNMPAYMVYDVDVYADIVTSAYGG